MKQELLASEALFSFAGWITCRERRVTASAYDDAGVWAQLVGEFCKANNFAEPREDWNKNAQHPAEPTLYGEKVKQSNVKLPTNCLESTEGSKAQG